MAAAAIAAEAEEEPSDRAAATAAAVEVAHSLRARFAVADAALSSMTRFCDAFARAVYAQANAATLG